MDVRPHIERLRAFVEARDFAGHDPYDALNSPVLRALSFGTKYGRIAWTQFMRRCPLNLRPLLGVPRQHNPKGLGLFLGGYTRLHRQDPGEESEDTIRHLIALLTSLRSPAGKGHGWGYNFDWQSRAAFVPRGTPTIVNSAFVGHALLDAYERLGIQDALDLAAPTAGFMLEGLNRKREGETFCFSYTPTDRNYVHNANMLGASLLIRLHGLTGEAQQKEAALASLAYSMNHQQGDGSWFYAETDFQRWVDSFHTGFNLEALRVFLHLGQGQEYRSAYVKGRDYYARTFFLEDGTPKYYNSRLYPIDVHAPAQGIAFFSQEEGHGELTERILSWLLREMWDERGFVFFRKTRSHTNRIPYMRWAQAWAFHALTRYHCRADTESGNAATEDASTGHAG